ncbi:MAG TPA: MurR/RpiR family transcriptional regulator [Pseudonocardia sp.]|uniref:MurR/RpiR family transcriptional regulator n=1 Tax=Pseudonocardia sp. TaxID=60912 RepID=UPI002B4B0605|nr:MurR/RpiR family transcriptional regulator [Pseudonocardia sp.]HLU56210.1 MurR/RpiR family transcriptional regulator [Pseudonocardia sp.]
MAVTAGSDPPVEAGRGQLLSHLRSVLPGLAGALRQVGNVILEDPAWASRATIVELGERSGTSPATVTRFCRSLGLAGYTELRVGIATDIGRADQAGWEVGIGADVLPTDPLDRVLRTLLAVDLQAMHETAAGLDLRTVEKVIEALVGARRVDMYGVGGSAAVLEDIQMRMHRIGLACWTWSDVHAGLMSAALLGPGDVAIALTHSGRSTETVDMLSQARSSGATTVAITNFSTSPIADVAEHLLCTSVRETSYRSGEMSARHSQFLVLDLLYLGVAQRTHERATETWTRAGEAVAPHRMPYEQRSRRGEQADNARGGA